MSVVALNEATVVVSARRVIAPALIVGVLGLAGFILGAFLDPERAYYGWLAAYAFALTIVLGALCLVMIGHAMHARWIIVVRRVAESVIATLPLFVLLFVPILFGMPKLYPWFPPLDHVTPHLRQNILKKEDYLNVPFWLIRAVVYFVIWIGLGFFLRRWSLKQDRDPDAAPLERAVRVSAVGLVFFGLALTWAAIDWIMSLSPEWVSTIFGAYVFAGGMFGAMGLLVILVWALERAGYLRGAVASAHYYALGRLCLVFTLLWAYFAYSQGFLIWIANLPSEVPFYIARTLTGWGWVFGLLVIGHFAIPFVALLMYRIKRRGGALAVVGAWMLLMHYADVAWLVLPALHHGQDGFHWSDFASLAAVLGLATAFGAWRLVGHSVVPWRDPRLPVSLSYDSR